MAVRSAGWLSAPEFHIGKSDEPDLPPAYRHRPRAVTRSKQFAVTRLERPRRDAPSALPGKRRIAYHRSWWRRARRRRLRSRNWEQGACVHACPVRASAVHVHDRVTRDSSDRSMLIEKRQSVAPAQGLDAPRRHRLCRGYWATGSPSLVLHLHLARLRLAS